MASEVAITHRFEKLLLKYNKFLSEAVAIGNKELIASVEKRIKILKKRLSLIQPHWPRPYSSTSMLEWIPKQLDIYYYVLKTRWFSDESLLLPSYHYRPEKNLIFWRILARHHHNTYLNKHTSKIPEISLKQFTQLSRNECVISFPKIVDIFHPHGWKSWPPNVIIRLGKKTPWYSDPKVTQKKPINKIKAPYPYYAV